MDAVTLRQRQYRVAIRAQPDVWQYSLALKGAGPFQPAFSGVRHSDQNVTQPHRSARSEAAYRHNLTWTRGLVPNLIGQDRFYGAPGQSPIPQFTSDLPQRGYYYKVEQTRRQQDHVHAWGPSEHAQDEGHKLLLPNPDWSQFGSDITTARLRAGAEKNYTHTQDDQQWRVGSTLLGQDEFFGGAGGLRWPPDWTQFGPQIVEMRRRAGAEKQYTHAQSDIEDWSLEQLWHEQSIRLNLLANPDLTQTGEQVQRQRLRAGTEKQYVHATADNRWGEPVPLIGQDRIYRGPGQVPTVDWTQFGLPRHYGFRPDQLRSAQLRWHAVAGGFFFQSAAVAVRRSGRAPYLMRPDERVWAPGNRLFRPGRRP